MFGDELSLKEEPPISTEDKERLAREALEQSNWLTDPSDRQNTVENRDARRK